MERDKNDGRVGFFVSVSSSFSLETCLGICFSFFPEKNRVRVRFALISHVVGNVYFHF